jgi:hypothetical protein
MKYIKHRHLVIDGYTGTGDIQLKEMEYSIDV